MPVVREKLNAALTSAAFCTSIWYAKSLRLAWEAWRAGWHTNIIAWQVSLFTLLWREEGLGVVRAVGI